jgi:CRP/FNR family transcriptional regulator, dissimilatory nitrate respiration regulator
MEISIKKPHFVRDCYLFAGLNEEEFQGVGRITTFRPLKKNDSVFLEGDKADGFFFLSRGRVKLYKTSIEGKEQLLHIVYPGETFAEAAMFEGNVYPATAQVMDDSELLFIDKKGFLSLLKRHPEIGLRMLGNISKYLHHFIRLVEDLSLKEVSSRLAKYFLDVMARDGVPIRDGIEFNLDMARSDLASRLGTVRETLSRTLRTLRDKGVIEVDGKKIRLLDKDALEEIGEGAKP